MDSTSSGGPMDSQTQIGGILLELLNSQNVITRSWVLRDAVLYLLLCNGMAFTFHSIESSRCYILKLMSC